MGEHIMKSYPKELAPAALNEFTHLTAADTRLLQMRPKWQNCGRFDGKHN